MSGVTKPVCIKCGATETPLWHSTELGSLCNKCLEDERNASNLSKKNDDEDQASKPSRKSTRITRWCKPTKTNEPSLPSTLRTVPKGKGRRHIFKKPPTKAPSSVATPVTSNFVFYKGSYFQVGDVVSVQDIDDGGIYYAQIRGFITDQYCEKSAAITWLLPTVTSPPPEEGFSPETYIIGPEEDLPRRLECMEFIMHAPSDYYRLKNTPYPPPLIESATGGYIWTSLSNETTTIYKK
ncbi:GATA zinc finger domain-containing protein 1 isoform X2 [Microplitis demolitor]|uniref:GATA zinc finger domain-containing protein 1 isoform X2 n=1 Tax=Microplitis demolitor TaxID=69319 RepID=UPI0004CCAE2F|nr:GATA zinc finger domain-containing protein 1 isoform X2 [Microplitis demolitor]